MSFFIDPNLPPKHGISMICRDTYPPHDTLWTNKNARCSSKVKVTVAETPTTATN